MRELLDNTGAVRARYDYDVWGNRTKLSGDLDCDFGSTSYWFHPTQGTEIVFHTAAHFRDSYKGGDHSAILQDTNVRGTAELLAAAYAAGIRRFVCTSSIATLKGSPDTAIDETMRRDDKDADPYYLSKILADREVDKLLDAHPDMWAAFVLPGWMWGPGDRGPTSAGQILLDFVNRKIPGVPPGSFAIVDARDVAAALIAAAEKGRRGERYLAAGRAMSIADLFPILERVTGIPAPKKHVPIPLLFALGGVNELWARITRRPVLLSLASVRLMVSERSSRYDHAKSERELGLQFRPLEEKLSDTLNWYRAEGWIAGAKRAGA